MNLLYDGLITPRRNRAIFLIFIEKKVRPNCQPWFPKLYVYCTFIMNLYPEWRINPSNISIRYFTAFIGILLFMGTCLKTLDASPSSRLETPYSLAFLLIIIKVILEFTFPPLHCKICCFLLNVAQRSIMTPHYWTVATDVSELTYKKKIFTRTRVK